MSEKHQLCTIEFDAAAFRAAERMMNELPDKGFRAVNTAMTAVGKKLVLDVRVATPVQPGSGALQDSIRYFKAARKKSGLVTVRIGADSRKRFPHPYRDGVTVTPASYLHLVEFGSSRSRARPFIRKVLGDNGPRVAEMIFDTVTDRVAKAWTKRKGG